MLNLSDNDNEKKVGREIAIADIISVFNAGITTTADSLEYFLLLLAKYQDTQEMIYKQIFDVLNNKYNIDIDNDIITMQMLNQLDYLRAFMEQAWALKAFFGVPRVLHSNFKMEYLDSKQNKNDYYILPKGSTIMFNPYIYHIDNINGKRNNNNNDNYKERNTFDFSDYLDSNGKYIKPNKLNVFGYGMRACPGQSLARKQVMFTMAILIYKYKFYGPNGPNNDFQIDEKLLSGQYAKTTLLTVEKRSY